MQSQIDSLGRQLHKQFADALEMCRRGVKEFLATVDDREYYQEQIQDMERMKKLICGIKNASAGFLETWDMVLKDREEE